MGKIQARERDPVLSAFGLAVQRRRKMLQLSQEEAAEQVGLNRTYFADIERGARNVGLRNIVKIAKGLGIAASTLLRDVR